MARFFPIASLRTIPVSRLTGEEPRAWVAQIAVEKLKFL